MTASGRQTAAPRATAQAALVTDSAPQTLLEASPVTPIRFEFSQIAPPGAGGKGHSGLFGPAVPRRLAPFGFSFPSLSAPAVSAV
ncbi:MAG TPA: hypothetical protein VII58_04640 [Acidobacteriaceae bacterium]